MPVVIISIVSMFLSDTLRHQADAPARARNKPCRQRVQRRGGGERGQCGEATVESLSQTSGVISILSEAESSHRSDLLDPRPRRLRLPTCLAWCGSLGFRFGVRSGGRILRIDGALVGGRFQLQDSWALPGCHPRPPRALRASASTRLHAVLLHRGLLVHLAAQTLSP
jgi:hypothetical protein